MKRYFLNKFKNKELITIGFDYRTKNIILPTGKEVRLKMFDTAGNYISQSRTFIKPADGVIIMYDINGNRSFSEAIDWIERIRDYKENMPIIIIRNFCDIKIEREMTKNDIEELAKKHNYHYYESSCKENINIKEPFDDLIGQILKIREENKNSEKNNDDKKKNIKDKKKKLIKKIKSMKIMKTLKTKKIMILIIIN